MRGATLNTKESTPTELCILENTASFFVLNKPAGIHSIGAGQSLASLLREKFPELEAVAEKPEDSGLLQRLDFETSGAILGAHSRESWLYFKDLLHRGALSKSYLALVEGSLKAAMTATSWLGGRYRGSKKVSVWDKQPAGGRALYGETRFEPVGHPSPGTTLVRANAPVARRHQVRAHAAMLGFPLVGDSLYGATQKATQLLGSDSSALPQFFLHAELLSFIDSEGHSWAITAPIPEYAKDVTRKFV